MILALGGVVLLASASAVLQSGFYRCGRKFVGRIVGGTTAEVNEWPWQVALMFRRSKRKCGGSLINDRYVLTAAHCVKSYLSFDMNDISVHLGDHTLSTTNESNHLTRNISKIIIYPAYEYIKLIHDIALLQLSSSVNLREGVQPICLPWNGPYENKEATVTGWGTTSNGGPPSDVLREVDVELLSYNKCKSIHGKFFKESMLCAGSTGKDSCYGDSGGPLVIKTDDKTYEQIGIVSWGGKVCGKKPGVYTKVRYYLDWIIAMLH